MATTKYQGVARTILDLNQNVVESIKDMGSGGAQAATIQKVQWLYAMVEGHMSEDGVSEATKIGDIVSIDQARELFRIINKDPAIITLLETGGY